MDADLVEFVLDEFVSAQINTVKVFGEPDEVADFFKFEVGLVQCVALSLVTGVIGFYQQFEQASKAGLYSVSEDELLMAREFDQLRYDIQQQIIGVGEDVFFFVHGAKVGLRPVE